MVSIHENVYVFRGIIVITISGSGVAGVCIHRPKIFQLCIKTSLSSGAVSYLSKGQGLTRDTLDDVTEADDLWLQSLERKKPDKKPRTADASPVSRAIVTAWNSKDHCESDLHTS